jgi:hypothetical protein
MIDHHWQGSPEAVAAAISCHQNVIGPCTLDGVAYVCVRADSPLDMPPGLSETGRELGTAILGRWA